MGEAQLLASPELAVRRALMHDREIQLAAEPTAGERSDRGEGVANFGSAGGGIAWERLQLAVLRAKRLLAYRMPGSLVASLALREAWASCLRTTKSSARAVANVARC